MRSRILPTIAGAALVASVAVAGPTAAAPTPTGSATASAAADSRTSQAREKRYERKVRVYTNKARKRHDRRPLHGAKCLDRFANRWARKMARRQELVHQDLGRILRRCKLSMAGENIAYGYPSGKAVVRGWMHSEGHRANILNRRYRLLGVGVARDDDGRAWASQVFGRR
ncbi:CAP domain-containing protein [Solicola gregarius]|uniref:CAP domain-containing protein n=1 Tax=Solicola gregarius TaxID=2908642 RepID=A0AA46TMV6_9ACTN|nr:CAP domain-containing protein [Solicola gregarius]UYM07298.1 CAP domain-containing protein [Solicola gregarius]